MKILQVAIVTMVLAAASWAQSSAKDFYERGRDAAQRGSLDEAIQDYGEAIRQQSDFADAYYQRGLVYTAKNDNDHAIEDYSEVIRLDPKYADAYYSRALARITSPALKQGDDKLVILDLTDAIRLKPDFPDAYYMRGVVYKDVSDYDSALADFDRALALHPDDQLKFLLLSARGELELLRGAYDAAVDDLLAAKMLDLRVGLNDANLRYNLGLALKKKGDFRHAIPEFKEAAELDPKLADKVAAELKEMEGK